MLVVMKKGATPVEIEAVTSGIEQKGCIARPIPGGERVAICVLHNNGPVDASAFLQLPGVKEAIPVTRPYKLVSRESQAWDTVIDVGGEWFCGWKRKSEGPQHKKGCYDR